VLLTPANSNSNQDSHANSDRECGKRAGFGLSRNPTQSIITGSGTDLDRLLPKASRFVDCCALATTETIYDFAQDRPDSLGDLIARSSRARGCILAGASSNLPSSFSMARK
jgi:hypothetical protein